MLPDVINLRITRAIMKRVPKRSLESVRESRKYNNPIPPARTYGDPRQCVICQAIRAKFPYASVRVFFSDVSIDEFSYSYPYALEPKIEFAHRRPNRFTPFNIQLTRRIR